MSFRVEEPYHTKATTQKTAVSRCSEPGCGKRFWHAQPDNIKGERRFIIVGIFPADAKRIKL